MKDYLARAIGWSALCIIHMTIGKTLLGAPWWWGLVLMAMFFFVFNFIQALRYHND